MGIRIILLIFVAIFMYFMAKKRTKTIKFLYVVLIAIPIGSTNILMDKLDVFVIKGIGINLIHCIIITSFLVSIKTILTKMMKSKNSAYKILFIFYLILIALLIGYINNESFIQDGQKYIMFLLWGCMIWALFCDNMSLHEFIKLTVIAININFIANISFNLLRPLTDVLLINNLSNLSEESGFVSYAANISLATMSFSLYYLLNYKLSVKDIIIYVINILLSLVNNIIFAGNRTYIILMLILVLFVAFSSRLVKTQYQKNKKKVLIISAVSVVLLIVVIISNDTIMKKINNAIENGVDRNLITRTKTISYYMKEIVVSPFGYGFGKELPLINEYDRFHGNSLFTDNAFINIGMKLGVIGLVCFVCSVFFVIKRSMANNLNVVTIVYVAELIAGTIMTGQIFNNYPMSFFFIAFSLMCINNKGIENKKVEI